MGGVQNGVKKLTPLTQKKKRPPKKLQFLRVEIHFDCENRGKNAVAQSRRNLGNRPWSY